MRRNDEIVCEVGDLPFGFTDTNVQDVMIIPAAAAVMTAKVAQPKYLSSGGFTLLPMTLWLLVRRMTSRIKGGARRPLITPCSLRHRVSA